RAKIASRLKDAREKSEEAEREAQEYRRKQQEFDDERDAMLSQATQEAETRRKELQAMYERSAELRQARRDKMLEYTRRQGKAYTLQATISAKMQRVKMIEKEDRAAEEEAEEFAHLEEDEELELRIQVVCPLGVCRLPVQLLLPRCRLGMCLNVRADD
ncbi:MAG: hypothetical protein ACPIOQ_54500, partial [Promethearchaeia archaeon]